MSIQVRPFRIFSKIRGDIRGSRCTTGVNDTGGKWKKSSSRKSLIILFGHLWVVCRVSIYKHFCLQDHFKVSAAWHCSHYLPPVSTTPVANLPPVSLIPLVHLYLRISPRIFEKIRNDPNVIFRGLGEGGSWNKLEAKNLVTLSL